jgi:hypothetical protein
MNATSGPLPYLHGWDTWDGFKHWQYNDAVEELLRKYAGSLGGTVDKAHAEQFVQWLINGEVGDSEFLKANGKAFGVITEWRKGFREAAVLAEAAEAEAAKEGVTLSETDIKAILRRVINHEEFTLSGRAAGIALSISKSKALLIAAAKKAIPALLFMQFASAAAKGYSQGVQGQTGLPGMGMAMTRELVAADLVEGIVFPIIGDATDGVENGLTNGQGFQGAANSIAVSRGFDPATGDLLPQTGPNPNAVPHAPQPGNIWPPIPEVLRTPEELEYLDRLFEEYP